MISKLVNLKSTFIEFFSDKISIVENYFTKLEIHQECNMNDNLAAGWGILRNLDKLDFNSGLHDA